MLRINFLVFGCLLVLWASGGMGTDWVGVWGVSKGNTRQKETGNDLKLPVPTCWSLWAPDDHLGV